MFRKYPYTGWLILAISFWCLAVVRYYQKTASLAPDKMASAIERQLQRDEVDFDQLISDEAVIGRIFSETLSPGDVQRLTSLSYGLYAYRNDTIIFWNTNEVLADCLPPTAAKNGSLFQNERGKFVKKCLNPSFLDSNEQLVVLFPVVTTYPFENNYLKSGFRAGDHIPLSTIVSSRKSKNSYAVSSIEGKVALYVQFNPVDIPTWTPGNIIIGIILAALLFTVFWLQLLTIYLTQRRSFWLGFSILVVLIIGFRVVLYNYGYPFNIESLPIFSPQLYATSILLPSLGDLLLNAALFLWLVVFIVRYAPYDMLKYIKLPTIVRILLAIGFVISLFLYCFAFINIISSLVADSKISFDVSHFYTISTYTIIGLFTVGLIAGASFIVVYLFSVQLNILIESNFLKYLLIIAVGAVMIFLSDTATPLYVSYLLLFWLLLFIGLLDLRRLYIHSDLFAPQMIFWAAFICAFCTGILQYFNYSKEREARKRFAEQVVQQRDDITEYTFKAIEKNIKDDPIVHSFFRYPTREKRKEVAERFDALYMGGHINKYQARVLLYDERGRSLYNYDTTSYNTLVGYVRHSMPTFTENLYYRKDALDGHYYLSEIPIESGKNGNRTGYVFIDLAVKESTGETIYPELLQPGSVKGNRNAEGYSYGVYVNNKLITQTSDYNFPAYLRDTIEHEYEFTEYPSSSELRYKVGDAKNGDSKTVIVIRYHRLWLESITLFSYLFGMQMLISLFSVVYRLYFHYFVRKEKKEKLINFTLRRRIHISFLGIVFISFIIIGFITITFFTLQYEQNSHRKQQLVMRLIERTIMQYLEEEDAAKNGKDFNKEVNTSGFKYFITGLANSQKIDINLFHASGVLNVTSQDDIYDKALFARIMRPDAYYELYNRGTQFLIQNERIGRLAYVSCYVPLRNRKGVNLGYVNVPFFSAEKELNFQISSIVVGLINLYAFVFLLSGVLTVFITRWITKSFSVVIKSFEKFSLQKNEPVSWPYDDEIGVLVGEYNKMVKKTEENARMLAQSEREGAWREMAQQVAHEIKNPLTPMKLNIQYLQQALKNNYPNVNELAKKVSDSLIEQIENLSYIASEFSHFAKMPEARPETFDLNELLQKTVDLYRNQSEVTVSFTKYQKPLHVYADKSQILRVCNNLLENAVQAIPEDREGKVDVSVTMEGNEALIAFTDNGTGIEPDAVGKIFQPYFTTKTSGTGLGLAMTKKIIEFWKGTIRFETTPGKGTTFYITVPLANGDNM